MPTTRETWQAIDREYYDQQNGKPPIRIRTKLTRKVK